MVYHPSWIPIKTSESPDINDAESNCDPSEDGYHDPELVNGKLDTVDFMSFFHRISEGKEDPRGEEGRTDTPPCPEQQEK